MTPVAVRGATAVPSAVTTSPADTFGAADRSVATPWDCNRSRMARNRGWRSFRNTRTGAATKIEEFAVALTVGLGVGAYSSRVTAPMISAPTINRARTGRSDTTVVLMERKSTWFIDTEVICA